MTPQQKETMTQEQIEGNKLIAEFMNWKHHSGNVYWFPNLYPSTDDTGETTFDISEAEFHSSWSWLMPVVEKIESLGHSTSISSDMRQAVLDKYCCEILKKNTIGTNLLHKAGKTRLEAVYLAVIDFIKFYNQQK